MSYLINFLFVLITKLFRKNFDHFLSYKYDMIRKFYGKKCLDVGAGYGHFSHFIHSRGHRVKSIDVTNQFRYKLEFQLFDGKQIPLGNNSVNTSILMFVLHHTNNQIELLKEVSRVTKDYIIVGEDIVNTGFDKLLGHIHLNTSPWNKSDDLFHSQQEWLEIFSSIKLDVVCTINIPRNKYPVYPIHRSIFVLKHA
ncbi:MAG: class I SAM-dependent methyltransferase [Bacteroidota bacterium]